MNISRINSLRRKLARKILGDVPLAPQPPELEAITPEQLEEIRRLFPLPKFFIFGYPRSGTTLLMRLISLHPEIHCGREGHFFTRSDRDATRLFSSPEIRVWLERKSNRWTAGQGLETPLVRLVADFVMEREALREGKKQVGDKTPNINGAQAVERLHAVYPDARLIYIVRDGRDAALSRRFQHFIDHPEYLKRADLSIRRDFARDSQPFLQRQRSVFTEESLRSEALSWSENVTDTDKLGRRLFGECYTSIGYENLLAEPVEQMKRLWGFLGVDPQYPDMEKAVQARLQVNPGAEAQQKKESDLAGKLPRGRQGTWKGLFTQRDRQIFKECAGKTLIAWGYEHDLDW